MFGCKQEGKKGKEMVQRVYIFERLLNKEKSTFLKGEYFLIRYEKSKLVKNGEGKRSRSEKNLILSIDENRNVKMS